MHVACQSIHNANLNHLPVLRWAVNYKSVIETFEAKDYLQNLLTEKDSYGSLLLCQIHNWRKIMLAMKNLNTVRYRLLSMILADLTLATWNAL
jgi:hypothetical protein